MGHLLSHDNSPSLTGDTGRVPHTPAGLENWRGAERTAATPRHPAGEEPASSDARGNKPPRDTPLQPRMETSTGHRAPRRQRLPRARASHRSPRQAKRPRGRAGQGPRCSSRRRGDPSPRPQVTCSRLGRDPEAARTCGAPAFVRCRCGACPPAVTSRSRSRGTMGESQCFPTDALSSAAA